MIKLDYIWIASYTRLGTPLWPTPTAKSKIRIVENFDESLSSCPIWTYSGNS